MQTSEPVKRISRNYTYAIKSATTGRFAFKTRTSVTSAKKTAYSSARTVHILETRASRLRGQGA
jgi:hypothetical protein